MVSFVLASDVSSLIKEIQNNPTTTAIATLTSDPSCIGVLVVAWVDR